SQPELVDRQGERPVGGAVLGKLGAGVNSLAGSRGDGARAEGAEGGRRTARACDENETQQGDDDASHRPLVVATPMSATSPTSRGQDALSERTRAREHARDTERDEGEGEPGYLPLPTPLQQHTEERRADEDAAPREDDGKARQESRVPCSANLRN